MTSRLVLFGFFSRGADVCPLVSFPSPLSVQSVKKTFGGSSAQTHTWGGGGSCGHLRSHQPAQPFIQDPAMPPPPPPNTLAQLEEACRRLGEVSIKPAKQRYTATRCLMIMDYDDDDDDDDGVYC